MRSVRCLCVVIALCAGASVSVSTVLADTASRAAVKASAAQLAALNLPTTPDGSNVRVAILEALGTPELDDVNAKMPGAGQDQNGKVYNLDNNVRSHATMVTGVIVGLDGGAMAGNSRIQAGISNPFPNFILRSQTMLAVNTNRPADKFGDARILNMSLATNGTNSADRRGNEIRTQSIDWAALTQAGHPLQDKVMIAAGNEPAGTLAAPTRSINVMDNYNGITVGATSTGGYKTLATYNGVYDADFKLSTQNYTYDDSPYKTAGVLNNNRVGRFKTDILAPGGGDGVLMASPVKKSSTEDNAGEGGANDDGLNSEKEFAGTSFAAPHVTGAAALVTHLGNVTGYKTDHRVIKAVLLNGADHAVSHHDRMKRDPASSQVANWRARGNLKGSDNNNLRKAQAGNANARDVFIGWDEDLGTGLLDTSKSLQNYIAREQDPGVVRPVGWDLEPITPNTSNTYRLTKPQGGTTTQITATLAWDRFMQLTDSSDVLRPNALWRDADAAAMPPRGADKFRAFTLNDLDLEIWDLTDNALTTPLFASTSDMDSIEHVFFDVPMARQDHDFAIKVNFYRDWADRGSDSYGLAWFTVPTPGTAVGVLLGFGLIARRRREA